MLINARYVVISINEYYYYYYDYYYFYRQTLNVQASTKVTLLPVCF